MALKYYSSKKKIENCKYFSSVPNVTFTDLAVSRNSCSFRENGMKSNSKLLSVICIHTSLSAISHVLLFPMTYKILYFLFTRYSVNSLCIFC